MMPGSELTVPSGWTLNPEGPHYNDWTQDDVDQFVDTYYRTGPGANFNTPDLAMATQMGSFNPAAAIAAKNAYMAAHPDFATNPFVPGLKGEAARKAAIDAALPGVRTNVQGAFTSYGVDPASYSKDIEDRLASIVAGINLKGKEDINSFFPSDLGTKLIGELETGRRNRLRNDFSSVPTDFLPMTADDPFIESLLGEQRTDADQFVQRMIDRGLISSSGAEGARKDLDRQAGLGRTRLSEIGTGLLTNKEAELDTERAHRLGSIDQLKLGDPFDVTAQKTDLNKLATDFIGTLGQGLRTGLGGAKLFDTSGLARIASKADTSGSTISGSGLPQDDDNKEVLNPGNDVLF